METTIELDPAYDAHVVEARKRFTDVTAIREERDRDKSQIWEWQFSDDPFLRARFLAEWPQAQVSAAQAEQYVIQARTRLIAAEQQAKAKAQPLWDERFKAAWSDIDTVLTGPLQDAMVRWESLVAEASAKSLVIPVALPNLLLTEAMAMWRAIVRKELSLDR
jgi:hypothetical protein